MADCIDSEPTSQHLPPNNVNFQRNWTASVMVGLASCDPTATLRQVVIAATRATGLKAEQTRGIYKNLKRGYAKAVRDSETPAYKYHPNARIAAEGRQLLPPRPPVGRQKLPENQNRGREMGRVGEEEQSGSRARVLDILYMYGHLHEPINTLVKCFVPIPILTGNS